MHPNHLGSTIPQSGITDQTGATTQKTRYYPFGQLWTSGGTIRDDRFPRGSGQVASMDPTDAATGNNPTLFRMNNSRLYRWLSPDNFSGGPVAAYGPPNPTPPCGQAWKATSTPATPIRASLNPL